MADPIRLLLLGPEDAKYQDLAAELITHLEPLCQRGLIAVASDSTVDIGEDIELARKRSLDAADIIAILVGPATPGKCRDSIQRALDRRAKDGERVAVLPILLFPGGFDDTVLAKLRPLPLSKQPVNSHHDRDSAWVDIVKALKSTAEKIQAKKSGTSEAQAATPVSDRRATPAGGLGGARMPKRAWLRGALNEVLYMDADFSAFCMDYFTATYRRFSSGMDRTQKQNLLMEQAEPAEIWASLKEAYPAKCQALQPVFEEV